MSGDSLKDYHTHAEVKQEAAGETWKSLAHEVCVSDSAVQKPQKPNPRKEVDTNETSNDDMYDDYDSEDESEEDDDSEEKEDETVGNDSQSLGDKVLEDSASIIKDMASRVLGERKS